MFSFFLSCEKISSGSCTLQIVFRNFAFDLLFSCSACAKTKTTKSILHLASNFIDEIRLS